MGVLGALLGAPGVASGVSLGVLGGPWSSSGGPGSLGAPLGVPWISLGLLGAPWGSLEGPWGLLCQPGLSKERSGRDLGGYYGGSSPQGVPLDIHDL